MLIALLWFEIGAHEIEVLALPTLEKSIFTYIAWHGHGDGELDRMTLS